MKHAFAPGHVSGLFAIYTEAQDPLQRGSRGAGWSLERGAHASVDHADRTTVCINGVPADAPVTRAALETLAEGHGLEVNLHLGLPTGQGFGMSAAGTLAACLGATALLELEPERALEAAHRAEIQHASGLGDAIGSWFGGGELRVKPGCPPHGWAMQIAPDDHEFLFCVLGQEIATASIIGESAWKEKTRALGDAAVDRIMDAGREGAWQAVLEESAAFSAALGLRPDVMVALQDRLPSGLRSGQCMLGSTLWVHGAQGDLDRAEALLEAHGKIIRSKVDPNGARLVRGAAVAAIKA